jgi:uncharacterized protein HemX
MMWKPKWTKRTEKPAEIEASNPALKQALGDFKVSVRAWSDAAYNRPRTGQSIVVQGAWRLAAGWSLAAVLLAGATSGGFYQHHQRVVAAQVAAAHKAEQERQAAAQRARDTAENKEQAQQEDDVLASVDNDVSREVPSAMEPLAQLTDDGESK